MNVDSLMEGQICIESSPFTVDLSTLFFVPERHHNAPSKGQHQSMSERQRFSEDPTVDVREDFAGGGNVFVDSEGVASSSSTLEYVQICVQSERAERGRKGLMPSA